MQAKTLERAKNKAFLSFLACPRKNERKTPAAYVNFLAIHFKTDAK